MTFSIRYPNVSSSDNHLVASPRDALRKIATHYNVSPEMFFIEEYLPGTTFVHLHDIIAAAIVGMVDRDTSRTFDWVCDLSVSRAVSLARLEAYSLGQERQWYHAP